MIVLSPHEIALIAAFALCCIATPFVALVFAPEIARALRRLKSSLTSKGKCPKG